MPIIFSNPLTEGPVSQSSIRGALFGTVPAGSLLAPRGLECIFEYNGLVMNDRRWIDQYRITRVTGLDDADVRDNRESNPDRDGETAGRSLYGGRTISITGYVQAGNLDYLRYMWAQFKAATDNLFEKDLLLRWYDWNDEFLGDSSALVLNDYSFDTGSGTISAVSGELVPADVTAKILYAKHRRYADSWQTFRFRTGASVASHESFATLRRKDGSNYLAVGARSTSTQFGVFTVLAGSLTAKTTVSQALSTNTTYWVRARVEGNVVTAQLFNTDPNVVGATPVQTVTHTLTAGDATALGTGIVGTQGIRITPGGTDWRYHSVDMRALNPGDMVIPSCRKFAKVEGDESWDGMNYRRPFMLTLRSSSPVMLSRMDSSFSGAFALAQLVFPGGGGGLTFPASGGLVFGGTFGTLTNLGYSPTSPVVRFTGPVSNPVVVNLQNGTRVGITGSIASGEWLEADCSKRRIVDNTGADRYDRRGLYTNWLMLEGGANSVVTGADAATGTCTVTWRHATR